MTDLIERIESAEGPSRELDAEIAPLVGLRVVDEGHPIGKCFYDKLGHSVPLPAFTASIDAALALVPEGWCVWQMGEFPDNSPLTWHCTLWREGADNPDLCCYAPTLALAICAAALRARGEQA